ncbi:MAG: damage-control phosphatase ARMT1 family protein [Chitinispirillaceae bacterium]
MKTYHDCLSCFVNQALGSLRRSAASQEQTDYVMRQVFRDLSGVDYSLPPPVIARSIFRRVCDATGVADPLSNEKKQYNRYAREILSALTRKKEQYSLEDRIRLAIAGNIIDFGKNADLTQSEVSSCFEKALGCPIDSSAVRSLEKAVSSAGKILFLCDNAGEIVFDRFLLECMPREKIVCAVRGKPVINDATMEDARAIGLADHVKVISNGSDVPGTLLHECSPEFKNAFRMADVVIAKGQGNFETLSEMKHKRIFFVLQVKCPVISRDLGCPVGTFLIKDNGVECADDSLVETKKEKEIYHG